MARICIALMALLLGASTAALQAADSAHGRLAGRDANFATEAQPAATPSVPEQTLPAPTPAPAEDAAGTPAAPAAPPAGPGVPGCNGCGAGADGSAGPTPCPCLNHLIEWITYRPLYLGVKCATCCGQNGDCCCYHCAPPLYLFFAHRCQQGPPHLPSP
jgi:hypothetical protein